MLILILRTKQRVKILATCLFLAITISPWIPGEYQERVKSIFVERESRDDSAASRTVLWRIALRIWQDHPIAGVGLENFSPVKETYSDKVADIVSSEEVFGLIFNRQRYPHGMYTGLLAETGLVGTGLLLALLLRSILCRLPQSLSSAVYFQSKAAKAGLIGFAVSAIFGDFQYLEMVYLQLFFISAVRTLNNRSSNQVVEHVPAKWKQGNSPLATRGSLAPSK